MDDANQVVCNQFSYEAKQSLGESLCRLHDNASIIEKAFADSIYTAQVLLAGVD